jgi:hypothetical protein
VSINRFCSDGGLTVDESGRLLDDTTRYHHPAGVRVGCSRLVCGRCGADVRNHPGVGGQQDLRDRIGELYETADWSEFPGLEPIAARLYACRCTIWLEASVHSMEDPDPDPLDPILPWRCSGHPCPTLPTRIAGEPIEPRRDFSQLVRRVFRGRVPLRATELSVVFDEFPAMWLCDLYAQLRGLPEAAGLLQAIAELLDEPNELLRGGALYFFSRFPEVAGAVVDRARRANRAERARTWPTPFDEEVVETSVDDVLLAVVEAAAEDPNVRALAREGVREGWLPDRAIATVAGWDGAWLTEHVAVLAERWEEVFDTLVSEGQGQLVSRLGTALARSGVVPLDRLQRWLREPRNRDSSYALVLGAVARREAGRTRPSFAEALASDGPKMLAWELTPTEGRAWLTVFSLEDGRAVLVASRSGPEGDSAGLTEGLRAAGHVVGVYDEHCDLVWTTGDSNVSIWGPHGRVLEADGERLRVDGGGDYPRDAFAAFQSYADEDDYIDRGVRARLKSGEIVEIVSEPSATAAVDPTYNRSDLIWETAWTGAIAKALARWANADYESWLA